MVLTPGKRTSLWPVLSESLHCSILAQCFTYKITQIAFRLRLLLPFFPVKTVYLYVKGLLTNRYMTSSSHRYNSVCRTNQGHLFYEGEKSQRCDPWGDAAGHSQPHSPAWAERGLEVQELPHTTLCACLTEGCCLLCLLALS